ncbi:MAG: DUF1549 domain-containing protein, partial [Pirellula sp.]
MLGYPFIGNVWLLSVGLVCYTSAGLLGEGTSNNASPALPVYQRIDELVEREAIGPLASLCNDADFLRRVTLDLTGAIPTVDQVRAFLSDSSPNKRERVITQLIESQEFVRNMAVVLDVTLLERRNDKSIDVREWEGYLIDSVATNKPLDQLFGELIFNDGPETTSRIPTKFILNRDAEPNAVTRDVGRLAFGMDMQCAQCHDHPLIKDYLQEDYYGLYAYWHRIRLFTDPKSKALMLSEEADGEASFKSVFTGNGHDSALPRAPKGNALIDEPWNQGDAAYVVVPAKDNPGKPKFSRRRSLSESLSSNLQFRRNLANRLWLVMFGRGMVHPIDLHHTDNPPTHPALLQLLADELANQGFQLRPMIRQIAMSRTYQRSCDVPDPTTVNFRDIAARKVQLSTQHESLSKEIATLATASKNAKSAYDTLILRHQNANAKMPSLAKKLQEVQKKSNEASQQASASAKNAATLQEQFFVVREAAKSSANALSKLPNDASIKEITDKLGSRASELSAAYEVAAKKHAEAAAKQQAADQETGDAQKALSETMREQVRREELEPLEQAQLAATIAYETAVYELKSIEQKLSVCQLAEDYVNVRGVDKDKAEAAWQSLVMLWTHRNQIAPLKPLSSEQLAISMLLATGTLASHIESAKGKLQTTPPEVLKNALPSEKDALQERL